MTIILAIVLIVVVIWLLPSIIMACAALFAVIVGIVRGTKAGFTKSPDIKPASPRIEAMRASSARMKQERLDKRAARKAKKEARRGR